MKVFKRILAGAVSAAVLVSVLAVPTAALSSTMTHNKKSGKIYLPNGKLYASYTADTAASISEASATVSSSQNLTMGATLRTVAKNSAGNYVYDSKTDGISGTSVTVHLDNLFPSNGTYLKLDIVSAIGNYNVNDDSFDLSV